MIFETQHWLGEPRNREPEKCAAVRWYPLHDLPADLIDYPAVGILGYVNGEALGHPPVDTPGSPRIDLTTASKPSVCIEVQCHRVLRVVGKGTK